jgi:hypothetical protein
LLTTSNISESILVPCLQFGAEWELLVTIVNLEYI